MGPDRHPYPDFLTGESNIYFGTIMLAHCYKASGMRRLQSNIEKLRNRLVSCAGSDAPFCIKKKNDEVVVTYIRGFADPDCNIVLVSEESHSLRMNIIEIKDIEEIQPWIHSAA
jgi:hypothetical protein